MAYLKFLIEDLANRVKDFDIEQDPTKRTIAKRYINNAAKWIYASHHWEWRYKTGQITLIPNYTTGTCTVTGYNGSNSASALIVNFTGATLTTAMQGRYIKIDGEDFWHRIVYVDVSNNRITLDSEIVRTSASGLTFKIWKRFYYIGGDVAYITDFGRWDNRFGRLDYKSFSNLVDRVQDVSDDGTPEDFTPFGVDNYEPVYTTGSLSGNKDGNLFTGGGGAGWLGNVLTGDEIIQGDNVFYVKRVEADQRIISINYFPDIIPVGSSYEIRRNLSLGFQFFPNQVADYMTVPYYYYDRMFNLVHETKDRPNLLDDFDDAIVTRAEYKLKKDKGDSQWVNIRADYSTEIERLKKDFRIVRPRYDIFAPEIRGYPGR